MRLALTAFAAAAMLPAIAFAAGSVTSSKPEPTETTEVCEEGLVFDLATETCLPPEESTNDDSAMMDAVRELAYDGRYADALRVLDGLEDNTTDLALTYYGFSHRKAGDVPRGMAYYQQALDKNPDNLLARSYMGQAHVEAGKVDLAKVQLAEIRSRGGAGTWVEQSLAQAINSGKTYGY